MGKIKQVFVSPKEHASSTELKIMSWNVRLFDLYNWSHNTETKAKMFELLENEQADIICFQEFFYQKEVDKGQVNIFNTRDTLKNILNAKYCHDEYTDTVLKRHFFGAATFSKYPIVNTGKIFFGDVPNNLCLFTDVLIKKDTVRIYNMHLASIRLKNKDYKFIEEIKNNDTTNTDFATGSKSIVKQMKMAYLKRVEQSKQVLDHINQCTYPVILCGDFNDPPFSYTYQKMRVKLHDSFTDAGFGLGATHTIILPVFRIDDILSDDHFTTKDFRVIRKKYSDHYPVTARLYYKTVEPKQ